MAAVLTASDDVFSETGWPIIEAPPAFSQRHMLRDGRMYCETIALFAGRRDAAVALFRGPWTWWQRGRILDFHELPDGSSAQILVPVWWYTTRVGLHIYPPVPVPDTANGVRLPLHLSRHFVGFASIDVIDGAAGQLQIRGRFHGVENRVPLIPTRVAVGVHLRAEAGTLLFPFPRGTGWPGLARLLAAPTSRS